MHEPDDAESIGEGRGQDRIEKEGWGMGDGILSVPLYIGRIELVMFRYVRFLLFW